MSTQQQQNEPVVGLICNVCGSCTQGRQWWNRDHGFGICRECADEIYPNKPIGYETTCNGIRGYHFDLQAEAPK